MHGDMHAPRSSTGYCREAKPRRPPTAVSWEDDDDAGCSSISPAIYVAAGVQNAVCVCVTVSVCRCATHCPMPARGHHAVLRAEALEW